MKTKRTSSSQRTFACETCHNRQKAEANPKSLMARIWRWHTRCARVGKFTKRTWLNRRRHNRLVAGLASNVVEKEPAILT